MSVNTKINVFKYKDYRDFLRDWYESCKSSRAGFSFRTFSKRAGFTSPNFFKLVMDGERNLTEDSLQKFLVGLKLNKQEQEFFTNLVFYNQAHDHDDKDRYYQNMMRSRQFSQLRAIEKQQYEYYSTWYHPVVRELVVSKFYDGTSESIANRLSPEVTVEQVARSIELLANLGFIERVGKKGWKQSSTLVSTGDEVQSVAIFKYHKNLLDLSKSILDRVPSGRRDISTLTLGIKKERVSELKKKVQEFRKEILKLVSEDVEPEDVVQLNIQLLPLTRE
ncbi:MAG: TIGR02147 family protein [Deltaproteobacteria bacterium]|nr:MAG: TIGR02147 family protein [Deltaproteobacteria bacterium]